MRRFAEIKARHNMTTGFVVSNIDGVCRLNLDEVQLSRENGSAQKVVSSGCVHVQLVRDH